MPYVLNLWKAESGQTMIEYGLLGALISIAVLSVLVLLGPNLQTFFQNVNDCIDSDPATAC